MKSQRRIVELHSQVNATEGGFALLGTLAVVIILGVMVAIALTALQPKSTPSSTTLPGTPTTTTVPQSAASGAQEAAIAACQVDFQAITTAIAEYQDLQSSSPAAGTAWATSRANGGPLLQAWPSDAKYFNITWNGSVLSVVPARGAASHGSAGTSSPATGCFAA